MFEGQFDSVFDLFDLVGQSADVLVGDVGDLFEQQRGDLGLLDDLQRVMGPGVDDDGIADAQSCVDEAGGEGEDLLVIAGSSDEDALGVDELTDVDDRPHGRELAGADDDEALGQEHIGSGAQGLGFDFGATATRMRRPPTMTSAVTAFSPSAMSVPQLFGGSVRRRASSLIRFSSSRAVRRVFDSASLRLPAV